MNFRCSRGFHDLTIGTTLGFMPRVFFLVLIGLVSIHSALGASTAAPTNPAAPATPFRPARPALSDSSAKPAASSVPTTPAAAAVPATPTPTAAAPAPAAPKPSPATTDLNQRFLFIDNGQLRLGVERHWGAGIAWISRSGSDRNLINHFDHGRLIQQSYYGAKDGSMWNKTPWNWNPVQGGDWRGNPARVLNLESGSNWIRARSQARHWASGVDLTNVIFQEFIELTNALVHVKFEMSYTGTETHPSRDHEIPAFFTQPDLDTLVVYDGARPWSGEEPARFKPGWPNQYRAMTERWCAYVDAKGEGIGAYVPAADRLTCYRYGDGRPERGACSYFAPLTQFPITPGMRFGYDLYITLGTEMQIRERFRVLHQSRPQ